MMDDWKKNLENFADPNKDQRSLEHFERLTRLSAERQKSIEAEQAEEDKERWRLKWRRIVGERYQHCRFPNFRPQPGSAAVIEACREAESYENPVPMLWIGDIGAGKDHLMAAMLVMEFIRGRTIRRDDGASFAGLIRDQIREPESEADFMRTFTDPDIWAISDPDGQRRDITDHHAEWLIRIVDRRYRDGKPTWATINATTGQEAATRLGSRLFDRLQDNAVVMWCLWPSYRGPAKVIGGAR